MFDFLAFAAKPFIPYAVGAAAGAGSYLWFKTKLPLKRAIRLSAREAGLAIKTEKTVRETDKNGNFQGTTLKTTFKDVKGRIESDKEGIVAIEIAVPPGIAENKVVAFRQTLESVARIRLLPQGGMSSRSQSPTIPAQDS